MNKNTKLDTLILENIGDIEASIARATEYLDRRLWEEMAASAQIIVENREWLGTFDDKEDDISFAPREWHGEDENDEAQFYFSVGEVTGPDGDSPYSWVSEALASNPQGATLGLYFVQNVLSPKRKIDKVLTDSSELIQIIQDEGFILHNRQFYITILLNAKELSEAYADEDFSSALAPLNAAITKALDNRPSFDELVKAFREASEH